MNRATEVARFYELLRELEARCGGRRTLNECHGRMGWPPRGVYFFFEPGERRKDDRAGDRVVRVGTHALTEGSGSRLWGRLSQHRGSVRGGTGNHRGSIFRLLVGSAIKARAGTDEPRSWGVASGAGAAARKLGLDRAALRQTEAPLEREVSRRIGAMPFLWLEIDDPPGPASDRGYVERNAIALLSNFGKVHLDAPSAEWLGRYSDRQRVRGSSLWNNDFVEGSHDAGFLDRLQQLIEGHGPRAVDTAGRLRS